MRHEVVIVAVGARTPLGLCMASSAAAVRARISRIADHPYMVDIKGDPVRGAIDALIDPGIQGLPRLVALATGAFEDLTNQLPEEIRLRASNTTVLLATPEHRPGFTPEDEHRLLQELRRHTDHAVAWQIGERGHAGALHAIGIAAEWITSGKLDFCIAGGVDSYFDAETIDWLTAQNQLAGASSRTGFFPGEGSCFIALASRRYANANPGMRALAIVRGCYSTMENSLIKTDEINLARALTSAVDEAAKSLYAGEAIDDIWCDLNGERYRTDEWSYVLLRSPHVFRQIHGQATTYQIAADVWGDMGAASGALIAGLAVRSWERGYAGGPFALTFSGSEAGLRTAVVLQRSDTQ
jgi:3-oxoacyl-[acyl-carrier-protein] synthase I